MPAIATVVQPATACPPARSRRALSRDQQTQSIAPYCRGHDPGSQTGTAHVGRRRFAEAHYAGLPKKTDHAPIVFVRRAHALPRSRAQAQH